MFVYLELPYWYGAGSGFVSNKNGTVLAVSDK